jgi:hypothetical protein
MTKRILVVAAIVFAGCQTDAPPDSSPEAAESRPEDWAMLDAAIADALVNPELAHTREFYGSGSTRVLYDPTTFPPGYVPKVPGYQFEAFVRGTDVPHAAPKALTVDLRWFRGQPMLPAEPGQDPLQANQAYRDHHKNWLGIELCLFNGGGSGGGATPIGGCSVYYEVSQRDGNWLVKYKGAMDP